MKSIITLCASMLAFASCGVAHADATRAHTSARLSALSALAQANAEARQRPDPARFSDATQIYDYAPGALYEVYAAPGFISTILLEPGEAILTVASGDTTRWMVEEVAGADPDNPRALVLLKPTRADIRTNIVLVSDRHTYSIEAIAVSGQTYSAQTSWRYPNEANADPANRAPAGEDFNFAYHVRTVRGPAPRWRPVRVFDDGHKTYVEFPQTIATSEAPPLFVTDSGEAALVNYRVSGNRYVIDRLFDVAELRLGAKRPIIVRITRDTPAPPQTLHARRRP